jgi:hypothetical protein
VDTAGAAITSIAKESKKEHESQNALHPYAGPEVAMAAGSFNSSLAPFSPCGGLLSSCSVPCNRWGMIVCGSGERMEILKTLQKQELLAPVEHAVAAIFVVRKAGEKQC